MRKYLILFMVLFNICSLDAQQEVVSDTMSYAHFDCNITQTKQKLDKHFFASTTPLYLRVNNVNYAYATLQLGKRKSKIYMYIQIQDKNVCIKKDKVVDILLKTGEIITFKNDFPLNCDGFFAKQLKKKEAEKLKLDDIDLIKVYTYEKNYELYVSQIQNVEIDHQLDCLSSYKIKKSDEVKLKKKDKKNKIQEEKVKP